MRDQLLGQAQPMLSILLDPGESVTGEAGRFAWMTDSIEMAVLDKGALDKGALEKGALEQAEIYVYTATGHPGVVAFASQRPSHILGVEVGPPDEGYLVRRSDLMARTHGVQVRFGPTISAEHGLALCRIGGSGRAWVGLAGDVVRRELTAGQSLRAHPEHVGMFSSTVAIQLTHVHGISARDSGYRCAVLSGPGTVWLQSMRSTAQP